MAAQIYLGALRMFGDHLRPVDCYGYRTRREDGEALGKALAALIGGDDGPISGIGDITARGSLYRMVEGSRGVRQLLAEHDWFWCPGCGSLQPEDGNAYNTTSGNVECETCAESLVLVGDDFYDPEDENICLATVGRGYREYIMCEDAAYLADGDTYSIDWAEQCGYMQWGDGYWRDYSEDDDDDDDDACGRGIHQYHSHPLRNSEYFAESATAEDPALGFEHEVYVDGDLHGAMDDAGLDWILERDGSLDSTHGVEIVSPPKTLSAWRDVLPGYHKALASADCSAFSCDGDYGIHITVHRRHLTPLQEARIALFLASEENLVFIRTIAQRTGIYCGRDTSDIGGIGATCPKKYAAHKAWYRSAPLNLTEKLAEFRIFRSNTKPGRLLKNLEFVHALLRWTSVKSATGSEYRYQPFLTWLKGYEKEYPELLAYLRQKEYKVYGMRDALARDWEI